MEWAGDLLRFFFSVIADELPSRPVSLEAEVSPAPEAQGGQSPQATAQDDVDEDLELYTETQREFLRVEAQLPLVFPDVYNFGSSKSSLEAPAQKKVIEHLNFVNQELEKHGPFPVHRMNDYEDIPSGCESVYSAARYARDYGQVHENIRGTWSSLTSSQLAGNIERINTLNKFFEQRHQYNDITMATTDPSAHSSKSQEEKPGKIDHVELYQLISSRICGRNEKHSALIRVPKGDGAFTSVDMYLPICSNVGANQADGKLDVETGWHETSFQLSNPSQCHDDKKDICLEVGDSRKFYRRLCLAFSRDKVWIPRSPRSPSTYRVPGPVRLDIALGQNTLAEDLLQKRYKQALVAHDLVRSVRSLYPGPWIQQQINPGVVQLVSRPGRMLNEGSEHVYFHCGLSNNWTSTEDIWPHSQESQGRMYRTPAFFLSLAELLIYIYDTDMHRFDSQKQLLTNLEEWGDSLRDRAQKLIDDGLLEYYGQAIRGCLDFAFDYNIEREQERDKSSIEIARAVVNNNILRNLEKHSGLWGAQFRAPSHSTIPLDTDGAQHSALQQGATTSPTRKSFFSLFSEKDELYEDLQQNEKPFSEFLTLMENFKLDFILRADKPHDFRPVRVAILDTGLCIDEEDRILCSGGKRILENLSRNFLDHQEEWADSHGHGTHVARLLLRCTVSTQIMVLKVSRSRNLETTSLQQVIDALEWAGKHADIINLSFGLDEAARDEISPVIEKLVFNGKLIFAAASNSGPQGRRAYPAKQLGVFAVHATGDDGTSADHINPPRNDTMDNFATLGYRVPSRWKGKDVLISGTSFATPMAVAIAANVLEFVRRAPQEYRSGNPGDFSSYKGMRKLFSQMASRKGDYDWIRPWKDGMFDMDPGSDTREVFVKMHKKLGIMSVLDINEFMTPGVVF